jgi:hypothetical protein
MELGAIILDVKYNSYKDGVTSACWLIVYVHTAEKKILNDHFQIKDYQMPHPVNK